MSTPAAVLGDRITGVCATHSIVNPATGTPQPGVPQPFSAPVTLGAATRVLIGGRPALVVGANGLCMPPHVLHPADPFFAPPTQMGVISAGSATVLIEGRPAARTGSSATICGVPGGTLAGTASTVLIGG